MTDQDLPKRTYPQRLKLLLILLAIPAACIGGLFGLREYMRYQMYCDARDRLASQIKEVKRGESVILYNVDPRFIGMLFAEPECVERVEELAFTMLGVADERLARLKALPNVRYIYLYTSQGTDDFFKNIVGMESLERIEFDATDLSEEGIRHLAEFSKLKSLSLGYAEVSEPVLRPLKELRTLEEVTLYHTEIDDSELECLKKLSQLRRLDLRSAEITSNGVDELQEALPNCRIEH